MFEDIAGIDDIDLDQVVTGPAAVAEAFGRRITTQPGDVFYDPAYVCTDLGAWQSRTIAPGDLYQLRADIERCAEAEKRITAYVVDVTYYAAGLELRVKVSAQTVKGPFELTATVDPDEGVKLAITA